MTVGKALIDPYKIFEKISLSPGMRVADLGCGRTGHFVFPAARLVGDRGIVYAVDVVRDVLENIKSRVRGEGYDNVQAIWSDIELFGKTPVPDKSLDACFLVNVMFLVKDRLSTLQEAARLLKDKGVAAIVEWAKKLGPLGPAPDNIVGPEELATLASQVGLSFKDKFEAGDYHYCLILQKE